VAAVPDRLAVLLARGGHKTKAAAKDVGSLKLEELAGSPRGRIVVEAEEVVRALDELPLLGSQGQLVAESLDETLREAAVVWS
jgi:hypothetical protein